MACGGFAPIEELMNVYVQTDIVSEIRKGTLKLLGHVERMLEERIVKKWCLRIPWKKISMLENQEKDG
jgi:hypothetical protein